MERSRYIDTIIHSAEAQNIPREKSRIKGPIITADGGPVYDAHETGDQTSIKGGRRIDHDNVTDRTEADSRHTDINTNSGRSWTGHRAKLEYGIGHHEQCSGVRGGCGTITCDAFITMGATIRTDIWIRAHNKTRRQGPDHAGKCMETHQKQRDIQQQIYIRQPIKI